MTRLSASAVASAACLTTSTSAAAAAALRSAACIASTCWGATPAALHAACSDASAASARAAAASRRALSTARRYAGLRYSLRATEAAHESAVDLLHTLLGGKSRDQIVWRVKYLKLMAAHPMDKAKFRNRQTRANEGAPVGWCP